MMRTMLVFLSQPKPMSPRAWSLDIVDGPKLATTGLMPSSCWRPMTRAFMVDQPVRPSSGHRTYPETPP